VQIGSGWLQGIQYFRAISVIEVIVIHAIWLAGMTDLIVLRTTLPSLQKDLIFAVAAFVSFGVAHFIFISGVVLYHKYSGSFHVSTFYKKRLSSVLPPYLVWSTFYYFYPIVIGSLYSALFRDSTYGSNISLSGFATQLAIGIGHLWFVVLIIQLYLLYPFLVKLYNRFSRQKNTIFMLSLVFLVQLIFRFIFLPTSPFGLPQVFFLSGIFYFVFGFFVAEHYGEITQKVKSVRLSSMSIVVVLSTVCYAVILYHTYWAPLSGSPVPSPYIWLFQITGPFYCLLLIVFYLRLSAKWGEPHGFFTRYLEKIGEDSFGIFLIHFFFIFAFAQVLTRVGLGPNNLLFYPTLVFLTLISSYWGVRGLYHLPFSTIIIGKPRKKEHKPSQTARLPSEQ
jgi:probable poly-beta-1,6-N-acetyl-D-glucosamine export protein